MIFIGAGKLLRHLGEAERIVFIARMRGKSIHLGIDGGEHLLS